VANPLENVTGGVTNTAPNVLGNLVGGETVFVWKGNGYYQYVYAGAGVGTSIGFPSDYYDQNPGTGASIPGTVYDTSDGVYWTQPLVLKQGQGVYIQNPNTTITNTFVGTAVLQNTNTPVALPGGYALTLTGSTVPVGGNVTNISLPFVGGETVFIWKGNGYYQYVYAGAGVGTSIGFPSDYYDQNPGTGAAIPGTVYDTSDGVYWTQPLSVNVGQGFFVQNPNTSLNWTQNLVIP